MRPGATFDKSKALPLYARIGEEGVPVVLVFKRPNGTPVAIDGFDFELPVYLNPGDTVPKFTLTLGDGLTVIGADLNKLQIGISNENSQQRAESYFWLLKEITEDHSWLNGPFTFHNGEFDGFEEEDEVTITLEGDTVEVSMEFGAQPASQDEVDAGLVEDKFVSPLTLANWTGGGGGGTVVSFSSGNLNPLFTTQVATSTTTPALSFSLNTQVANTVFAGPTNGADAPPTFRALVASDIPALGYMTSPMTTQGDIIYGGALGLPTRLGIGSANTILGTNNAGNAPEYKVASNGLTAGSGTLKLGGTLTANTAIDGQFDLLIGVTTPLVTLFLKSNTELTLQSTSGSLYGTLDIQPGVVELSKSINGYTSRKEISLNATQILITDSEDTRGLQYAADYSANGIGSIGNRWIPDWGSVLTGTGTFTNKTWNGSVIGSAYGGTGVANNAASTITISGNFATTITVTNTTGVTLPVSGTLATLAGAESLTNKKLGSLTSNGFVKTSSGDGTLSVDTSTYLTSLSGAYLLASGGAISGANTFTGLTSTNVIDYQFTSLGTTLPSGGGHFMISTTTAAQSGAQQIGGVFTQRSKGWSTNSGGASMNVDFSSYVLPVQGAANPSGALWIASSINGGAYAAFWHAKGLEPTGTASVYAVGLQSAKARTYLSASQYIEADGGGGTVDFNTTGSGHGYRWFHNGGLTIGSGTLYMQITVTTGNLLLGSSSSNAKLYVVQSALSSAWLPVERTDPGAHTAMTAATEFLARDYRGATQTWIDGTVATQRFNYFKGFTLNKTTSAATFTDAYTVYVEGSTAGSGVTITNNWALGLAGNLKVTGTRVNMASLPTSSAGLATGDLYTTAGAVMVA